MATNTADPGVVRTHVITGDRAEVLAAVQRARAEGRLVTVTQARLLSGDRVRLVTQLRGGDAQGSKWPRYRRWLIVAAKILGVLALVAAVAAAVWAIVWLVMAVVALVAAVIAWVQAHLLGIGLAALVLFLVAGWLASSAVSDCGGMHCGGCRR